MRRPTALVAAFALALAALTSCTGGSDDRDTAPGGDLPAGDTVVKEAAAEMRKVRTAEFDIATDGTVDRIGIRGASGVITNTGDARGTARIDQAGSIVAVSFVVVGDTLHLKGPTGGWQQVPLAAAAAVYDPSQILNPERGIANVLGTAVNARTEAREAVDGVPALRVKATLRGQALAGIAPGISQDVDGTLWIGADRRLLHRASFVVPGEGAGPGGREQQGGGTVTVSFRRFDAPVTISAP